MSNSKIYNLMIALVDLIDLMTEQNWMEKNY